MPTTPFASFVPAGANGVAVGGSVTGITRVGTTGTVLYDTTFPIQPPVSAHTISSAFAGVRFDFTATANCGMSVIFTVPALPPAGGFQFLASWNAGTISTPGNHLGDLSMDETGKPRWRDGVTLKGTAATFTLTPNQVCRAFIKCNPGSATGHQVQLFVGTNVYGTTPDFDSGTFSATAQSGGLTVSTTCANLQVGQTPSGTNPIDMQSGRMDITNDGTDPGSMYPGVPAAPTVTATPADGSITLTWAGVTGQAGVLVWRATAVGGPYAPVTTQPGNTATSYTDSGLTNGTAYYYCVRLKNSVDWSPRSPKAHATPAVSGGGNLYPVADLLVAGCTPTGGDGTTCWSAIDEPDTPSDADYVTITPGSTLVVLMGPPPDPPAAGDLVVITYRTTPNSTAPTVASLTVNGSVIDTDSERDTPGQFSFSLTDSQLAQITSVTAPELAVNITALSPSAAGAVKM